MLDLLSTLFIVAASIPATVFPIVYATRNTWWRVPSGRALMVSTVALALVLDLTLVFRVALVPSGVAVPLSVAVLGLVAVGAWLMLGALVHDLWSRRG